MKLGILCSQVRTEEKLIFRALESKGVDYERLDERYLDFQLQAKGSWEQVGVVWCRSISHTRSLYALSILNGWGVKTVNRYATVRVCGDKVLTTTALIREGVPTPRTSVALSTTAALQAIEDMGYPVVLKPAVGSWGRLLSRVNDRDTAEAVLNHKESLGGPQHRVFYIQEHVEKPNRDIRAMVVGDDVLYAMYRCSDHWITNTARGAEARQCPISDEIRDLALAAAQAVGGGILAVDLMESPEAGLLVGEVNDTPEFHGAMQAVDVDIAGRMVDYVLAQA